MIMAIYPSARLGCDPTSMLVITDLTHYVVGLDETKSNNVIRSIGFRTYFCVNMPVQTVTKLMTQALQMQTKLIAG